MTTRKIQKLTYNIVIICLLFGALIYVGSRFIHLGVEYTDNAQVKQHITPVNTRVSGFIQKICFEEYQPVHKGDNPADYRRLRVQTPIGSSRGRLGKCPLGTTGNLRGNRHNPE